MSTKFEQIEIIDTDRLRYIISKAINDEVYKIVIRSISFPMRDTYSLLNIQYMSKDKYQIFIKLITKSERARL